MTMNASDKQLAFIRKLETERGQPHEDCLFYSTNEASQYIGSLLRMPVVNQQETKRTMQITEDGMYLDPTTQHIYKVQRNKASGDGTRMYAKQLHITGEFPNYKINFVYAQGAVYGIKPEWRMTLEDAAVFGKLYGICCNCGRTLTN